MELASVVIQPAGQLVQAALPVVLVYVPARQGCTEEGRQKKRHKHIRGGRAVQLQSLGGHWLIRLGSHYQQL